MNGNRLKSSDRGTLARAVRAAKPETGDDWDSFKARLKTARLERDKVRRNKGAVAGPDGGSTAAGTKKAISFESKLAEARAARQKIVDALDEAETTAAKPAFPLFKADQDPEPGKSPAPPQAAGTAPKMHAFADLPDAEVYARTPTGIAHKRAWLGKHVRSPVFLRLGGLCAAGVVAATVTFTVMLEFKGRQADIVAASPAAYVKPASAFPKGIIPALGAEKLDLLFIVSEGVKNVDGALAGSEFQVRQTPFAIESSTVEFFNDEDAESARILAEHYHADIVDLRGLSPSPPQGQVVVRLAASDL